MQTLHVIDTGGTFGKAYATGLGVREMDFPEIPPVRGMLQKFVHGHNLIYNRILKKDSLDITPKERTLIAYACLREADDVPVIIIHGTDTAIKSGERIHRLFATKRWRHRKKTVIIVGASTPACMIESDAAFNLGCAIGAAHKSPPGVYIGMSGNIFDWDKCYKGDDGIFRSLPR